MTAVLTASNVSKRYCGVQALARANFALRSGETHALTGENGAGKSTLMRILAGAVRADEADIRIDGRPVSISGPLEAQRLGVGLINQELDLFAASDRLR